MTLNAFDWAIIGVYLMGMIGFFLAYAVGYLISLAFAKPDPARLKETLFQGLPGLAQSAQKCGGDIILPLRYMLPGFWRC